MVVVRHIESDLQIACFRWFRLSYRDLAPVFFAIPNGGSRNKREACWLKMEGVTAGVADAILLAPRGGYSCLCVEFKTGKGRQSPSQKNWQQAAEKQGAKYVIVRDFELFRMEIENYLAL